MYLGGFDAFGACAALWGASATGFTVSGVFRDQADFATLYLFDADDTLSNPLWKYLPDFDFTGVVLSFTMAYDGLQPIDSIKYNWIDWATLGVIAEDGTASEISLIANATATGATSASCTFTLGGTLTQYSVIDLWYLNIAFEFDADGVHVPTAADVLSATATNGIAYLINNYAWPAGVVPLTATVSGSTITLTAAPGLDGNYITLYTTCNGAATFTGSGQMMGGTAATSWAVSLNFSALGITSIRQMWLTFAPVLALGAAYVATEWSAVFTDWTLSDPDVNLPLPVAGPGSVRIGSQDFWANYTGSGWGSEVGFYYLGFAEHTANPGDFVEVMYQCQFTHNLYLGTSLYSDRGIWSVSVSGDTPTDLDCYLATGSPVVTQRLLRTGLAPGSYIVKLTLLPTNNADSTGFNAYFDYLDAAVLSDVPDAPVVYPTYGVSLDWDTNSTWQMSPERLVWQIQRSGISGDVDNYLGGFYWYQKKPVGAVFPVLTVTIGALTAPSSVILDISGTDVGKSVTPNDSVDSVGEALKDSINETFIGIWASYTYGSGVVTVTCLSPLYSFTAAVVSGPITLSGSLSGGTAATWTMDDTVTPVINRAVRDWYTDFFAVLAAAGMSCTTAFSMELINPPDAVGHVYSARFYDGTAAVTESGIGSLYTTQCSFVAAMQAFHTAAYVWMATAMVTAGLTPWLQFGEFLWWFDAGGSPPSQAYYDAETAAAAAAALGRPLAFFAGPTSSPAINSYADANWLAGRLFAYISAIVSAVLAAEAGAKFELLWPLDVDDPNPAYGGLVLNRYVNLPVQFEAMAGSGLNRFKTEGLSYGSLLRDLGEALVATRFPYTAPMSWAKADVKYLVPWFNGGCPWQQEFLNAAGELILGVDFWAWDQLGLLGLPLPLPVSITRSEAGG